MPSLQSAARQVVRASPEAGKDVTTLPRLAAVAVAAALTGCTGSGHTPPAVSTAQTGADGVIHTAGHLRRVHSPGVITDDQHLTAGRCHAHRAADGQTLPDRACTPGAVDPAVTPATATATICTAGWTATVRPPTSDSAKWKLAAEADYGDTPGFVGEYDHLVPLELGGANTTSNLWPEPGAIPNVKDRREGELRAAVCAGTLSLAAAQAEIAADWTTARP